MQRQIPSYRLYAGGDEPLLDHWIHAEPIAARSSRHRWHIRPHEHADLFQLVYVHAGRVVAEIDGELLQPDAPVLITMPPRMVHGFRFSRGVEGTVITVAMGRLQRLLTICDGAQALLASPRVLAIATAALQEQAAAAVAAIAREYAQSGRWQSQYLESLLLGLLIEICRQLAAGTVTQTASAHIDHRALAFRAAVDRHYRDRKPLASYARTLAVSETHLNRICQRAFGKSALAVLQERIILEACRDLRFTRHPVAVVAHTLGFDDPAYFARFFKKHTGQTPRTFRNMG